MGRRRDRRRVTPALHVDLSAGLQRQDHRAPRQMSRSGRAQLNRLLHAAPTLAPEIAQRPSSRSALTEPELLATNLARRGCGSGRASEAALGLARVLHLHGCATPKPAESARAHRVPNASTESPSHSFHAPSSNNGPKAATPHASAAPRRSAHGSRQ